MISLNRLGLALKIMRERADLTQEQLAQRAGLDPAMLSRYERGARSPHIETLDALLGGVGASLYDLAVALDEVNGRAPAPGGAGRPDPNMVQWMTWTLREKLDVAAVFAALGVHGNDPAKAATAEASFVEAARQLARAAVEEVCEATQRPASAGGNVRRDRDDAG